MELNATKAWIPAVSGAVSFSEGAGLPVAVVAAVGDDTHFVAVAAAAMILDPAAFGAGVNHAGVGNVGLTVAGLNAGGDGGGEDEESEECFHSDGFQVLSLQFHGSRSVSAAFMGAIAGRGNLIVGN